MNVCMYVKLSCWSQSSVISPRLPSLAVVAQQSRCYYDISSHVFGWSVECAIPTVPVKLMTSEPKLTQDLHERKHVAMA